MSALSWTVLEQYSVPTSIENDSNPLMEENNATSIRRLLVTPKVSIQARDGLNTWSTDAALQIQRSSDKQIVLDREDPSLGVGWKHEYEKGSYGARISYAEFSTLQTNLDERGRSSSDSTRSTTTGAADWQHAVSEKSLYGMNASISRSTFSGGDSTDSNYYSYNLGANLTYQLNEKIEPFISGFANRYDPDIAPDGATNLYAGFAGSKWLVNDKLSLTAKAGRYKATGAVTGHEYGGDISGTFIAEYYSLNAGLTRSVSPAGNGGFIKSDQLSGSWTYFIDSKTRSGADISLRKNYGDDENNNKNLSLWLSRDLAPSWNLRTYFTHKQTNDQNSNAHGNVLGLSLLFNFSEF